MPERTNTFFTPGSARSAFRMSTYSEWSAFTFLQGVGNRHCLCGHVPDFSCLLQAG